MLDQKALDAARNQIDTIIHTLPGALRGSYHEVAQAHTAAYLSAIVPADVAGLCERLNRLVDAQIDDNLDYIRAADEAMSEAVTALVSVSADLAAVKALANTQYQNICTQQRHINEATQRAEAAESSLASERAAHARTREALEHDLIAEAEEVGPLTVQDIQRVFAARLAYQGGTDNG